MSAALLPFKSLLSPAEEQLMWRVRMQDDPEAFAELVRRWEGPIQRLCHRMIGDAGRSQDLSQEVFARLFARRKVYQPNAKFSTYLWRIALNLCYDELRRACNRREVLLESPKSGEAPEAAELAGEDPPPAEALALPNVPAAQADEVAISRNAALAAYEQLGHQLHGAGSALIVSPARAEAGEVAQVEEDLAVMMRILEKAIERASGRESTRHVLGINVQFDPFSSRHSQSLYLDGYGALFVLSVRCPLLAGPAKEEAKEKEPDDSTWEQTKRELFGGGQAAADYLALRRTDALLRTETERTAEEYDAGKVESLKKGLLEALKNGANIRHLKDDDTIAVVVLGPPAGQPKGSEAIYAAMAKRYGIKYGIGSRRGTQAATGAARSTTLTIRVKKSQVDAFAEGKLTAEEFAKRASVAVY